MTILARRFAVICLVFSIFAMALAMIVENGARRGHFQVGGMATAPCTGIADASCKLLF